MNYNLLFYSPQIQTCAEGMVARHPWTGVAEEKLGPDASSERTNLAAEAGKEVQKEGKAQLSHRSLNDQHLVQGVVLIKAIGATNVTRLS